MLSLANENSRSGEAATEHSEGPEAAKKDERAIPKAATEHSESRRLLTLANENSQSGEAVTEHSEIPETAITVPTTDTAFGVDDDGKSWLSYWQLS